MFAEDLSRTTMHSFHYSIASLRETNLTPQLERIRVPVLGIYGKIDRIVDPGQGKLLSQQVSRSQVAYFEESGHFPMLDERERFHRTLREFLDD
jgi:pimeloyl-ACP methyl ester carboxylesterase